jgi:preprotein translocase subunit SecG
MLSSVLTFLLPLLLCVTALFLILLVLVQRGRGGGLAGAFGGMGGQSAFGTKAGDLFTRVTIGVAAFWIILCAVSVKLLGTDQRKLTGGSTAGAARDDGKAGEGATDKTATSADSGKSSDKPGTEPASGPVLPEANTPDAKTPEATAPEATPSDATVPAATPDTTTPATTTPAEPPATPAAEASPATPASPASPGSK